MQGYIISLRKENYDSIMKSGYSVVGFTSSCKIVEKVEPGDILIMYLASGISKFVGTLRVKEKYYWDTQIIWDDIYPKRLKTEPIDILSADSSIDVRNLKNDLSFITNKEIKKFGVYFMQGIRKLNTEDFEFLIRCIKKADMANPLQTKE